MFDEVAKKILESLDESLLLTEMYAKFSGGGYRAYKIDIKNFHEINPTLSGKKIAFVDGGNSEIIGSANFSLSLIRACYVIYKNNKKIISKKIEVYAFIKAANENNEICYKASFFASGSPINLDEISFSSFDHTLMRGINRAEISSVPNAIRRFLELKLAKLVSDAKLSDIIVLDGNLQSTLTNENKYLTELYESCTKNNVILAALSKTNSIFTDNGNLLSAVLAGISNLPSWSYHPIAEINSQNHKAELFFVKLNANSWHVFRFEIFNMQKMHAEFVIGELAPNCRDPIFIGYPYGLVEADRMARVSNQEKEMLKTTILVKLRNKNIGRYLNATNAHEILDRISF